ncbi:MAG: UTRA domain-containing protein [Erysipelotrichia bacterium]|nr:UTRA domain-containing protein [Erysipelotrichia bacterium]
MFRYVIYFTKKCPNFNKYDLENNSIYRIINKEYGIKLQYSEQLVDVIWPDNKIRKLLVLDEGSKIIYQHGAVYDTDAVLIEYSNSYMKRDFFVYKS